MKIFDFHSFDPREFSTERKKISRIKNRSMSDDVKNNKKLHNLVDNLHNIKYNVIGSKY